MILFALVTGKLPFDDENIRKLLTKVKSGVFTMPPYLHRDIQDLISKMLTVNPDERITIEEIKKHPWFNSFPIPQVPPTPLLEPVISSSLFPFSNSPLIAGMVFLTVWNSRTKRLH